MPCPVECGSLRRQTATAAAGPGASGVSHPANCLRTEIFLLGSAVLHHNFDTSWTGTVHAERTYCIGSAEPAFLYEDAAHLGITYSVV